MTRRLGSWTGWATAAVLLVLVTGVAVASARAGPTAANAWGSIGRIEEGGYGSVRGRAIRVAGDNNFPPFEYVDENGVYKGFDVDLLRAVGLETGLDIELVPMPWSEALEALNLGRVDAIQGMKFTPERAARYRFTDAYLTTSTAIFVPIHDAYIRQPEDLQGNSVAVQRGDFAYDLLSSLDRVRLTVTENQEQALDLLVRGKVDAFVGNRLTGLYFAQKKRVAEQIKIVGDPINPARYGIVTLPQNEALVELLNKGIAEARKKGTYDKIYSKWFGQTLVDQQRWLRLAAYVLGVVALAALVGSLLIWRWNKSLQREVNRRTRELAEAHRLHREILASVPEAIITVDSRGSVVAANGQAQRLARAAQLAFGREENPGKMEAADDGLTGRPFPDTPLAFVVALDDLNRTLHEAEPGLGIERQIQVGAEDRTYRYSVVPLQAGSAGHGELHRKGAVYGTPEWKGATRGAVVVLGDVTEEKRVAQRLLQEDKMRSIGRLVAGMAHEIRNPLSSLKVFAQLLPTKFDSAGFREEASRHVPAEIERLDQLVSDLLDFARPRPPNREPFSVAEAVEGVVALFRRNAGEKEIEVRTEVSRKLFVQADRNQIRQVLINLCMNSLQAIPRGGRINVSARRLGRMVEILVADNGSGIAPEDLNRVFDPFFTRRPDGTGLGLYISYQYTKENGGEIEIESSVGAGTKVFLRLPLAAGLLPAAGEEDS